MPLTGASVLSALVVLALLWAQVAGVLHRIEHAGGLPATHAETVFVASAGADDASSSSLHSCVLFDGLCMADGLPTAALPVPVPQLVDAESTAVAFVSWHSTFVGHFLSRGPPAA